MKKVNALVLTGFGLNCDYETAHVLTLAGANAQRVHLNDLIGTRLNPVQKKLADYQILVFGGGFAWGDDHGGGVILATRLKRHLKDQITLFLEKGGLVLGICNGFQTLVNLGLLPGYPQINFARQVALTYSDCGNFQDRWVEILINQASPCVFTKNIETMQLPIRHGEGKLMAPEAIVKQMLKNNLHCVLYGNGKGKPAQGKFPANPNGSLYDIAGICDPSGRIFGLMPHPEAFYRQSQHPDFTLRRELAARRNQEIKGEDWADGMQIFVNAVRAAEEIL